MDRRFTTVTLDEFSDLLSRFPFSRRIAAVHMHHTWRPNHGQWAGERTVIAMWRFHTQTNHWRDIAQHLTIGPDGSIWDGRDWNLPPASAAGHNGTEESGPFMIETVGDFDTGRDALGGAQRAAAVGVIARLLQRFSLGSEAVRFHREMTHLKTCPGTSVRLDEIRAEAEAARAALPGAVPAGAAPGTERRAAWRRRAGVRPGRRQPAAYGPEPEDAEPEESLMDEAQVLDLCGEGPPSPRPAVLRPRRARVSGAGRARAAGRAGARRRGKPAAKPAGVRSRRRRAAH